jgi:glycosyltransferase involved in cell wall biosynthesis
MDIYLLSSFSEGTSMTLLEAMSLGKPCVVTDVGGNPEVIIDSENGFVTKNNDINEFALSIKKIIDNDTLTTKFNLKSFQRYMQKFTVHKMYKYYENIYFSI